VFVVSVTMVLWTATFNVLIHPAIARARTLKSFLAHVATVAPVDRPSTPASRPIRASASTPPATSAPGPRPTRPRGTSSSGRTTGRASRPPPASASSPRATPSKAGAAVSCWSPISRLLKNGSGQDHAQPGCRVFSNLLDVPAMRAKRASPPRMAREADGSWGRRRTTSRRSEARLRRADATGSGGIGGPQPPRVRARRRGPHGPPDQNG
jgi:hypothetical protein